jgi:DNA-binding NarL/FixJ family response regulator
MASTLPTRQFRVAAFTQRSMRALVVELAVRAHPRTVWVTRLTSVGALLRACEFGEVDVVVTDADSDPGWNMCLLATRLYPDLTVVALQDEKSADALDSAWALVHGVQGIVGMGAAPRTLGDGVVSAVEHGKHVDADLLESLLSQLRKEVPTNDRGEETSGRTIGSVSALTSRRR